MLDFFFKLYYCYFKSKGIEGAKTAAIIVSVPLTLNIWLAFLYLISFAIPIRQMGGFFFTFPIAIICSAIGIFFRQRYVAKERYKEIKFDVAFPFYILGFIHWLFSLVYFVYGVSQLYKG